MLFDVLFEQWREADQAATKAWLRLREPRATTSSYYCDLILAMTLQLEAIELLAAIRSELRNEHQQVPEL